MTKIITITKALSGKTMQELSEKLNAINEEKPVFATNIFLNAKGEYDALVYWKETK